MKSRTQVLAVLCCAAILAAASSAFPQVITATVSGVVKDESGGVLPGATVTVKNVDTGISRVVSADSAGRYSAPQLALGNYEIEAELSGFKKELRRGVTLTVGREAVVDFVLQVGAVTEQVTVAGEAPLVETANSSIGALVEEAQIKELPLNGRSYTSLMLLQPGVLLFREANRTFVNRGTGIRVSISGAKANQVSYRLDGLDISNGAGTTPGSASGNNLGVDAIREFQVLSHVYSAEYGRSAGGVINVVTQSGTNSLHGSAFHFHRNDNLDARNFFDVGPPPEFKRNQFGGSLGGPIRRERTFFFGSYEGLRERLGTTIINTVPDPNVHNGLIPINGVLTNVGVNPAMRPYLDVWPLPNGRLTPATGTGELITPFSNATDEDYFSVRMDHRISDKNSVFGRYTFDDGRVIGPPQQSIPRVAVYGTGITNRYQYVSLQGVTIFSASTLNDLRFGFNRSNIQGVNFPAKNIPESLGFQPGFPMGELRVAVLDNFSAFQTSAADTQIYNAFEVSENFTRIKGAHTLKLGADVIRLQFTRAGLTSGTGGVYSFDTLQQLLEARPVEFAGVDPRGTNRGYWRQTVAGFYFQDDVRATSRLTANLGVRYEFVTTPTEVRGHSSTLRSLTDSQFTPGPLFENPSLKNFSPRIGLAWDLFGDGKTSLRTGFGLYFDQLTNYYWIQLATSNPPFFTSGRTLRGGTIPFPNAFQFITQGQAGAPGGSVMEYNANQPYLIHYTLGLQRQLGKNTRLEASYVGTRGNHQTMFYTQINLRRPRVLPDGKLFFSPPDPRINPALGNVNGRQLGGSSFYNGLQLQVNRRFQSGSQFQVAYTLSKNINDGDVNSFRTEAFSTVAGQNPFQPKSDRGLSALDIRQNVVANFNYELPFLRGQRNLAGQLAGGWQFGGIVSLSSGHPFTAEISFDNARTLPVGNGNERPDLVPGANSNPIRAQNPDRYFDPRSFALPAQGFLGNLARNTLIGPGQANVDLSVVKRFLVTENSNLEFRAEFFNLFNRPNFAVPNDTNRLAVSQAGPIATAGRITETRGTSRQIQFGLRYAF